MNKTVLVATASAVSFAIGAGAGYFLGVRRLEAEYDRRLEEELDKTIDYYARLHGEQEEGEVPLPKRKRKIVEDAADAMIAYNSPAAEINSAVLGKLSEGLRRHEWPDKDVEQTKGGTNIFEESPPPVAVALEVRVQKEPEVTTNVEVPHVIKVDEFGDTDFEPSSMTYYALDRVLMNELGEQLSEDEIRETIGNLDILRFGELSGDPNIIYVRNTHLQMDFEIARSPGAFATEVLGQTFEPEDGG